MRLDEAARRLVPPESVAVGPPQIPVDPVLEEAIPVKDARTALAPGTAPPLGRRPEFTPPTQLLAANQLLVLLRSRYKPSPTPATPV